MVSKVGTPLTSRQKASIAIKAGQKNALKTVNAIASKNLSTGNGGIALTSAHLELILVRVAAGDTVRQVCEENKISVGLVHSRSFNDPDFGAKLKIAREHGAQSLFEMMIDVAWNEDGETVERSKLKVSVLDRIARTYNRNLSDRQQIDVRQAVAYILPSDADDL